MKYSLYIGRMIQSSLYSLLCLLLVSCSMSSQKVHSGISPEGDIVFDTYSIDMGVVSIDSPIDTACFHFTNHADHVAVILGVKTSCDCTSYKFPHDPVYPGQSSYIQVIYNGAGRKPEFFEKTVYITTNLTDKEIQINITGELR